MEGRKTIPCSKTVTVATQKEKKIHLNIFNPENFFFFISMKKKRFFSERNILLKKILYWMVVFYGTKNLIGRNIFKQILFLDMDISFPDRIFLKSENILLWNISPLVCHRQDKKNKDNWCSGWTLFQVVCVHDSQYPVVTGWHLNREI